MKKIILLALLPAFFCFAQAQEQDRSNRLKLPYPKSIIELGVGLGPNFGILGGQMLVGYKGCGVLGALGAFDGLTTFAIGAQLSYEFLYFNVTRATVGSFTSGRGIYQEVKPVYGTVFMAGGKINLLRNKTLYLQLGIGYQVSSVYMYPFGPVDNSGASFALGIGYRMAFKKRSSA